MDSNIVLAGTDGIVAAWKMKLPGLIQSIEDASSDSEKASGMELEIYYDFFKGLAYADPRWSLVAKEMLKISKMKFLRW